MMSTPYEKFIKECEAIKLERESYKFPHKGTDKFFDLLSALFFFSGFIALFSIPFSQVTLLDATCLFVIHFAIAPSDGDRFERMAKGMAEDLGNIRANIATIRKTSAGE